MPNQGGIPRSLLAVIVTSILCLLGLLIPLFIARRRVELVFIASELNIPKGQHSVPMIVQAKWKFGKAYKVTVDTVVRLSSSSNTGRFDISPSGAFNNLIRTLVIPKGNNSAVYYYKDAVAGKPTIIAQAESYLKWRSAKQQFNVVA